MMLLLMSLAAADPAVLLDAMDAELQRSTTQLELGEQGPPWFVAYDAIEGSVATTFAEFGAVMETEQVPYRTLRVEVRTGDSSFDSANFEAFGEPDGTYLMGLPLDDDPIALQRTVWLATDFAYKQAVEQLARKQAELDPPEPGDAPAMWPIEPVQDLSGEIAPVDGDAMRDTVAMLSGVLAEYPQLEAGQAAGREWQGVRVTVTSEGTRIVQPTGLAVIRVEGVLKHSDGSRLRDGRWWVASDASGLPSAEQMEAEVRAMADWLVALESAPAMREYLGPVLFEGPASVELFRQLAASELVGTPPAQQGRGLWGEVPDARATGRVGRRLLPAGWSVVDDPSGTGTGSYRYDHEGVPSQRVELVQDGVVRRLLHSRVPDSPDGASNGHGRALGSSRRTAIPAVVTVQPHRAKRDKVLRRKGLRMAAQTGNDALLVIRRIEPPAMSEDFDVFFMGEGPPPGLTSPYEAYLLYPDGRQEPVRGLQFSGMDRRVLRDVVLASAPGDPVGVLDVVPGPERFYMGAVGGMPASWSVPDVLLAEIEINGRSGGEPRVLTRPD
jgi:hypothetical protein